MLLPNHGANPKHLTDKLNIPLQSDAIDFSVNTNPLSMPTFIKEKWNDYLSIITDYPDPTSKQLRDQIAVNEGISANQLLVGNGAAQLIFVIANAFAGKKVGIIEPTFSEYRDACRTFRCEVEGLLLKKPWQLAGEQIIEQSKEKDLLFICNPNNPTGVAYSLEELLYIVNSLCLKGVTVVVDEAFYDFQRGAPSIISAIKTTPNLIVLRSLTKMYRLAGLRLGYIACNETIIEKLQPLLNPWSVNGLAQAIGLTCLSEHAYVQDTQAYIARERERVIPLLTNIGYETSPSNVNFYLLKEETKENNLLSMVKYLISKGIIPRHTFNFPSLDGKFIRLAIKTKNENDQLIETLQAWKRKSCSFL